MLAVLVSTGKGKEVIGVQLTHITEEINSLSDKDGLNFRTAPYFYMHAGHC